MNRRDLILVAALLLLAGGVRLGIYLYGYFTSGAFAEVSIDGEVLQTYPIDTDREVMLETDDGHYNLLSIKDGKADITEADCRDGICVHHPPVSKPGETIVCLPHKLVVTIVRE